MSENWFYSQDGRTRRGPVSREQLRGLADAGRLQPYHFLLPPGERRWTRADAVPGLFPVLEVLPAGPEPPQPPVGPAPGAIAVRRFLSRTADLVGVLVFVAFLLAISINLPGVVSGDPIHTRDGALARSYIRHAPLFHPEGKLLLEPWERQTQLDDQERLFRLFADPGERELALAWGRRVVEAWRGPYQRSLAELERATATIDRRQAAYRELCDLPIDDTLAAHAAWRRLTCGPGASEAELFQLRAVVARAVPDPAQRTQLLRWASRRRMQRDVPVIDFAANLPTHPLDPAAPDTDWFHHWVLYDDLAVTDEVFLARRAELLALCRGERKLGRDAWQMALRLGCEAARERPDLADMGLSLEEDRVALLALRDRLGGTDEQAERIRQAALPWALRHSGNFAWMGRVLVGGLFAVLCPNDEVLKFTVGRGWGAFTPLPVQGLRDPKLRGPDGDAFRDVPGAWLLLISPTLVFFVVLGWLAYRGMRVAVLRGLGRLLGLQADARYQEFRRELERPRWALTSAVLVVLLTFTVELAFPDSFYLLYCEGPGEALLGVALSAMLGGLLVETITHVCTLVLLRFGFDPEKSWLDEVLAVIVATPLLLLFHNPWHLIVCSLLIGLTPTGLHKLLSRMGLRPQHERQWLPVLPALRSLYERRPMSVVLSALGLFVFGFCCLGCGVTLGGMSVNTPPDVRSHAAAVTHQVSSVDLARECRADPDASLRRYGGQWVRLHGTPRAGGRCHDADLALPFETGNESVVVRCQFRGRAATDAKRWRGGPSEIVGRFTRILTEGSTRIAILEDCVLTAAEEGPRP